MLFKVLTVILAVLAMAESAYILTHRRPINRFKAMEDGGVLVFDTATGQLCRSFKLKPSAVAVEPAHLNEKPSQASATSVSADPVLQEIDRVGKEDAKKNQEESDARADFALRLPACEDIR